MQLSAGKLWAMRRLADEHGQFSMVAFDQRLPIMGLIREKTGREASDEQISGFKRLLVEALAPHASAVLLDPLWAYAQTIDACSPRRGLILTLEDHRFEAGPRGRKTHAIEGWSVAKIKRVGGDGVKVLAFYRPDAAREVTEHQKRFVRAVGEACRRFDIPFILELLVYPLPGEGDKAGPLGDTEQRAALVIESVKTFAAQEYGVDLFKLESPIAPTDLPEPGAATETPAGEAAARAFKALGEAAGRPWVMLSAGADAASFLSVLRHAYAAGASGFLAGRAIWLDAASRYPDMEAMRAALAGDAVRYLQALSELTRKAATPWFRHPSLGAETLRLAAGGTGFARRYDSL